MIGDFGSQFNLLINIYTFFPHSWQYYFMKKTGLSFKILLKKFF